MVTAAGDDGKYKKGFTILKQAAIGLAVIGLARFIVSFIFWFINNSTDVDVNDNPSNNGYAPYPSQYEWDSVIQESFEL